MLLAYGNTKVGPEWHVEEKMPPGYSRVYLVYAGRVEYADGQHRTRLKTGRLYILPSASAYSMTHDPEHPLECTFLHLNMLPALVAGLIEVDLEKDCLLKSLMATISQAIQEGNSRFLPALTDTFKLYCAEKRLVMLPALPVSKILMYISDNINREITIGQLSSLSGYNAQYFIRLFKKTVGLSPYQYIINVRLKESVRLLREDLPVSRVAELSGYGDLKSFGRAFKERYGLTPTQFIRGYKPVP